MADLPTRLGLYRRIAGLERVEDVDSIADELRDRFGAPPWQVENLVYLSKLRVICVDAGILSIRSEDKVIVMQLGSEVGGARKPLERVLGPRVRVGNTQLRIAKTDGLDVESGDLVLETVTRLAEFRSAVLAGV